MTDVLSARSDLYERVTDEIVKAIEAGAGKFVMPWHNWAFGAARNAFTGDAYRGINVLALWAAAHNRAFASSYWATFKQWRDLGACVRKGEKATTIVFYKKQTIEAHDADTGETTEDFRWIVRPYSVFNADQVDGWREPTFPPQAMVGTHEQIDNFIAATGADIRRGETATYYRVPDYIAIPARERFIGSDTSSPEETFYSTVFHELIHWTGHWSRLGRNLSSCFGTADYAMEELVAELGAAFLCAEYLVLHTPRPDHAAYIAEWLAILKSDKRAIFDASTRATKAAEYLHTA